MEQGLGTGDMYIANLVLGYWVGLLMPPGNTPQY